MKSGPAAQGGICRPLRGLNAFASAPRLRRGLHSIAALRLAFVDAPSVVVSVHCNAPRIVSRRACCDRLCRGPLRKAEHVHQFRCLK